MGQACVSQRSVSIPFKSGKYSNIKPAKISKQKRSGSQSLLNQGNIQILPFITY